MLKNDFFFKDRHLLAEFEAADNQLKMRACLSESRNGNQKVLLR